ncbi:unnamed protein product [Urochloa decumbens]|uniref:Uncharacterized protein n=1 Tax=Urochloa decumbens TaxID=240449 RepID=A0ABC9DU27_9POAL
MDKVLAFSILSASPADIAAGAGTGGLGAFSNTRLSWRRGAGGHEDPAKASQQQQQRDRDKQQGGSPRPHGKEKPPAAASIPRFAPEFDGIDCFETIVSH